MYAILTTLLVPSLFSMSNKVHSGLIAMCSLVLLVLLSIFSSEEALLDFSDKVVVIMIGLFVVGGVILQTGLAKMISSKILHLAGDNEVKLLILVILATAFTGVFVSNTGTAALMMSIVVSMVMSDNINSSWLLVPMAFASSMGGVMILIGTPPNLIIKGELVKNDYEKLAFSSSTPVGIIHPIAGLLALIPASKFFLSKKGASKSDTKKGGKSLHSLVGEYQLSKNLYRVLVSESSLFRRRTLKEMKLSQ